MVDGLLAADLFIYVYNERLVGPTKTLCWDACIRWGLTCSWLGIKDDYRKVQPPSQAPGIWYGTINNSKGGVHRLVSKDIWDKNSRLI